MKTANIMYFILSICFIHILAMDIAVQPKAAIAFLIFGSFVFIGQANALFRRANNPGPIKVYVGSRLEVEDYKLKAKNFQLGAVIWLGFAVIGVLNLP